MKYVNLENALKPVESKEVFLDTGEVIPNRYAVVVGGEPVSVVSSKYLVVENQEVVDTMDKALRSSGLDLGEAWCDVRFDGVRTLFNYNVPSVEIKVPQVGDIVRLRLQVRNSYDAGWSFTLTLASMRLACLNGMVLPNQKVRGMNQRHTQSLDIEQLIPRIGCAASMMELASEQWGRWAAEAIDEAQADSIQRRYVGLPLDDAEKVTPTLTRVRDLSDRYFGELGRTKWGLYNALTHHATHDSASLQQNNDRDRKVANVIEMF